MARIYDKKVQINPSNIRDFFEQRGLNISADHPLTSVLYQDEHPEIAEGRDRFEKQTMLPLMNLTPQSEVLDVGCGIGRWAEPIAGKVARYHGVDFSQSLLATARSNMDQRGVTFQHLAAEDVAPERLSVASGFTNVIIVGLLIYLNDDAVMSAIEGIIRCCAPNCRIYIREPVASTSRLTLQDYNSDELKATYNAIYRTQSELNTGIFAYILGCGFKLLVGGDLYPDALNNRSDTSQQYYILRESAVLMFAFDLDGTVTRHELLPLIAAEVGLQLEMKTLTELTLSGAIGFEESFRLRCAILRSIPISVVQSVVEKVPLDEDIVRFIDDHTDNCCLVTGNLDVWIAPIAERLGCKVYSSVARAEGDRLISLEHILHKSAPIRAMKDRSMRVIAIGESVNDVPMFEVADVGIAFAAVHRPSRQLLEISDYVVFEGKTLCRLLSML